MKVELLKTTKLLQKGEKHKKLAHAGSEVEITDAEAKRLIKDGIAVKPGATTVVQKDECKCEDLKKEIESLKAVVDEKDKEIESLKAADLLGEKKGK